MSDNLHGDLNNPYLFDENKAGDYEYGISSTGGKTAEGSLKLDDNPTRDVSAQTNAGGELRRDKNHDWGADDGGHLIGARFGGETGEANLTAQNRNLNRSGYKSIENDWAAHLKQGDKVYVHMETDSADRPNAYMGYAIFESKDGERTYETYHFVNEGKDAIGQWEQDAAEFEAEQPEAFSDMQSSETSYGDVSRNDFDYVDLADVGNSEVEKSSGKSISQDNSSNSEQSLSME